ncbi:MAG: hypothetical protein JNL73_24405 [Anaerolineales bacterium]|nr:hypothetical protein [Anaerolineales bacterium]
MSEHCIVRVYPSLEDAEAAVKRLSENAFPIGRISIVTKSIESSKRVHGFIAPGDVTTPGVASGAWMGGLFGLLVGAAFVWVPGLGPLFVAGPFAAALVGGMERVATGATGDGLLSALQGWGVSRDQILMYEEVIRGGTCLLIGNGDEPSVRQAGSILDVITA